MCYLGYSIGRTEGCRVGSGRRGVAVSRGLRWRDCSGGPAFRVVAIVIIVCRDQRGCVIPWSGVRNRRSSGETFGHDQNHRRHDHDDHHHHHHHHHHRHHHHHVIIIITTTEHCWCLPVNTSAHTSVSPSDSVMPPRNFSNSVTVESALICRGGVNRGITQKKSRYTYG